MEFEEKFDTDDYADTMLWLSAGATHTYEPTGGWSGGCAKFTPSTSEGYSGLANFGNVNARKVNIRFLYYVGSTYNDIADNNKWMIINRDPYADGTRIIIMQHPVAAHSCDIGVCANIDCSYSDYRLSDYLEEWICFEFESDLDANLTKVYLTTQDLVYNGTVIESHDMTSPETGNHGTITIIGGYYQGTKAADDNRYIKYDELKISTSGYIGPPAGFLGDSIKFDLAASDYITASGENTTAQLIAPSGKTTSDFQTGRIQDDENPTDSMTLDDGYYDENEWCVEATDNAVVGTTYQFRVTKE